VVFIVVCIVLPLLQIVQVMMSAEVSAMRRITAQTETGFSMTPQWAKGQKASLSTCLIPSPSFRWVNSTKGSIRKGSVIIRNSRSRSRRRLAGLPRFRGSRCLLPSLAQRPILGGHKGAYTPFTLEITRALKTMGGNELWVEVDAAEDPSVPPFGGWWIILSMGASTGR
jgi:hypothetical protein